MGHFVKKESGRDPSLRSQMFYDLSVFPAGSALSNYHCNFD